MAKINRNDIDKRGLTASVVAISLPCLFFYPWLGVLVISSLFILAAWRWPVFVIPLCYALGFAAFVSQFADALRGDVFSKWWIAILIPWLIFLVVLALFDKKQRILGRISHCLARHSQALYFTGALVRILCGVVVIIAVLTAMPRFRSYTYFAFFISMVPASIIVLSEGVKMLRVYRSQSLDRA